MDINCFHKSMVKKGCYYSLPLHLSQAQNLKEPIQGNKLDLYGRYIHSELLSPRQRETRIARSFSI